METRSFRGLSMGSLDETSKGPSLKPGRSSGLRRVRREGKSDDAARADRAPRQNGRMRPENLATAPAAEAGGETCPSNGGTGRRTASPSSGPLWHFCNAQHFFYSRGMGGS